MEREGMKKPSTKAGDIPFRTLISLLVCLSAVLLLMVLAWAGLTAITRDMVASRLSPDQIVEMERNFNEPAEIPKDWVVVEPHSDRLAEFREKVSKNSSIIRKGLIADELSALFATIRDSGDLNPQELLAAEKVIESCTSTIADLKALVELPEYELNAFAPYEVGDMDPNLYLAQCSFKLFCLQAYILNKRGFHRDSFEAALVSLKISIRHPASESILHLIAIAIAGMTSEFIASFARDCSDEMILLDVLEEMNRLDAKVNLANLKDAFLLEQVSSLRTEVRNGNSVHFPIGEPPIEFYKENWDRVNVNPTLPDRIVISLLKTPAISDSYWKHRYSYCTPDYELARNRERAAEAVFDLARFAIASRIEEHAGNETPRSFAELVPEYFPEEPMDPFSGEPYLWSDDKQVLYSVARNGTDDRLEVLYDPDNEVYDGDLALISP